ncbi:hypothetical protein RB593_005209 [Gaeumannomyces tritici]
MSSSAADSSVPFSTLPPGSTAAPPSIYRPLDKARREIRILKIAPTNLDNFILHCSFIYASLDSDLPRYEALSYTWGEPIYTEGQVLIVNGEPFPVRENLLDALQTLCHTDAETVIWVDAVCINQSDIGERNSQVTFMRDVYRGAECVLAWLGAAAPPEEEQDEELAFAHMRILARAEEASDAPRPRHISDLFELGGPPSPSAPPLVRFLNRAYWSRTWIIQELAVARECLVASRASGRRGASDLNFYFRLFLKMPPDMMMDYSRGGKPPHSGFLETIDAVWASKQPESYKHQEICRLRSLLHSTHGRMTTDPRDRIYALLGLCDASTRADIEPDYGGSMTMTKLYRDLVAHCVRAEGSLAILLGNRRARPSTAGLPSWCPDLDDDLHWPSKALDKDYKGFDYRFSPQIQFVDGNDGICLVARGYLVDIISGSGQQLPQLLGPPSSFNLPQIKLKIAGIAIGLRRFVRKVKCQYIRRNRGQRAGFVGTQAYMKDATWRAMIRDYDDTGPQMPAPAEYGDIFYGLVPLPDHPSPSRLPQLEELLINELLREERKYSGPDVEGDASLHVPEDTRRFLSQMELRFIHRRMFVTLRGYVGLGPLHVQPEDHVCVLYGSDVPVVLRPVKERPGEYLLVGEAYVHGLARCHGMDNIGPGVGGNSPERDFVLV